MATTVAIASTSSLVSSGPVRSRRGRSTIASSSVSSCHGHGLVSEMRGTRLRHSKRTTSSRKAAAGVTPLAVTRVTETGTEADRWNPLPSTKSPGSPAERNTKGWVDDSGRQNPRIVAQLRNIAVAARDRAEMHTTIGLQRDNWNKLCHTTVVTTTVAAALLAALNGATPAIPLALTACLLNVGTAGLMAMAGKLQPSQLAEEQRSAARLCTCMAAEIEATLQIDPRLREDAHLYVEDKLARLHAVDTAYPLPLIPDGLPKFPAVVKGSALNTPVDLSEPVIPSNDTNGWTSEISADLEQAAQKLREADVEMYLRWARKKEQESLRLAVGAPALVAVAALLNTVQCLPVGACVQTPATAVAAVCSAAAMFCFSFAQGGQIGMIFEMYRNCAGSYADLDNTIQRALRMPVCQREDGELFHGKVALQLGRSDELPLVRPGDKTAGKVF